MNRDSTIIQAAILMIAIAILGIAIWRQQSAPAVVDTKTSTTVVVGLSGTIHTGAILTGDTTPRKIIVENSDEDKANLVKQYFRYLQAKDFKNACLLMSPAKCAANRQAAIDAFSTEFLKYTNGYEYVSVKDFNLKSPSGKSVVCVKYSYRLNNDPNPGIVSEIMSFYLEEDVGKRLITDRVCEKKYKDGSGTRPCPVEAIQDFCVGKIR